jgi:hypothetical protein
MTLDKEKLYYLASPYSKYPAGREAAFKDISAIAGKMIAEGYKIFSPIAHSHPVAEHGKLDALSHDLWLGLDVAFLKRCEGMIVAKMEGWDVSYGVNWEIDWWKANKDSEVIYVNP